MMVSGANNLYNKKADVDELNVFPVPDGDTGTNMSMTVSAMVKGIEKNADYTVTSVADKISFETLRSARGNSGVILSQFFRGISRALKGKTECDAKDFANALKMGADAAYKAVMNPTEGTVLTVAKEVALGALEKAEESEDFMLVLEYAVDKGNEILLKTPDMLPALKQAGVVDAGGQGWMYFLEGMLSLLTKGDIIKSDLGTAVVYNEKHQAQKAIDTASIKYKYCTEFIVEKNKRANVIMFKKAIETKGDSMLVIDDTDIVKVHIHTNNPGFVLEKAVLLGDLINIKIDNMKNQHQSLINDKETYEEMPHKAYGIVAIGAGDGMVEILKNLGTDIVVEGGQTMNPSTDDIMNAIKKVNADTIYVFPNNKNIIMAAEQAMEISDKDVIVIPSKSIPQCISALMSFNADKSAEENKNKMNNALKKVKTGQITYAVRDTEIEGHKIKQNDILGIADGEIKVFTESVSDALKELVAGMVDDESEFVTVYYGEDVAKEDANELISCMEEEYEDIEFSLKYGGQSLYYYIISVE